ncbi:MAG: UTP--glucose-1-phosphate uridylyltransferase GalU [Euryarchaeota archaeon]|nr:UTP--glucose-1-phosphate uridylyltransferase GalU [Euryarchaeota archaeon]
MKAVIPAAGMGIRFLPMTKDQPKEMLPVVHKPTIQYVVEEAVAAGITDILIITGRGKRSIEDHFDRSFELECALEKNGRERELAEIMRIANMADIHFVRQKSPRGLGDAVLLARQHVGNEPFAVMLGDTINLSAVPVVRQLMDVQGERGGSVIAVEPVAPNKVQDYGIISGKRISDRLYAIDDLVEKPLPENAPSNLGITGTYVLSPRIFECIERTPPGRDGEIQLTDALRLLQKEEPLYGLQFEGTRYDIGDKLGWLKTTMRLALEDPELGPPLREYLSDFIAEREG